MPLHLAFSNDSGIACEHLLFEGILYRLGNSPTADIVLSQSKEAEFSASLHAEVNDNRWLLKINEASGVKSDQTIALTNELNDTTSVLVGNTVCRFTLLSLDDVAEHDREYFKRRQQLRILEKDLQGVTDIGTTVELARNFLLHSIKCEHAAVFCQLGADSNSPTATTDLLQHPISAPVCNGLVAWSSKSLNSVAVETLHSTVKDSEQTDPVKPQVSAALCVPVIIDGHVAGYLYGDNTKGRRYFSQSETSLVEAMANILSLQWLFHTIERKLSGAR
ncbi:GAF domain-containing protein [Alteromonas lipolytica]|nr:GAF domain-containing protein [Alteromonas lipolytica]GGF79407.1 hypothetical protein GCM10011338_34710 [Alteromonas lipolytica]